MIYMKDRSKYFNAENQILYKFAAEKIVQPVL